MNQGTVDAFKTIGVITMPLTICVSYLCYLEYYALDDDDNMDWNNAKIIVHSPYDIQEEHNLKNLNFYDGKILHGTNGLSKNLKCEEPLGSTDEIRLSIQNARNVISLLFLKKKFLK